MDDVGSNTLTLGIGLRYRFSDSLNGSFQATDDELRTHSRDDSVSADLRLSFERRASAQAIHPQTNRINNAIQSQIHRAFGPRPISATQPARRCRWR